MKATPEERQALKLESRREAWRRGLLRWTLHESQREVYDSIQESEAHRFVLEIARQWGKTRLLATIATETALRFAGCRVVYGAPTLKHLKEFIIPTIEEVVRDAPADCKPVFNASDGHFTFPNGSYVHLFGAKDKHDAERGRGPKAKLIIFDEAGFTPVLGYVLDDVFKAQTLHSGGRTLLGSTPAEEPDHEFTEIAAIAEVNGNYARRTIYDNPLLSEGRIAEFIAQGARDKGLTVEQYMASDTFRREYLAERVVNKLLIALPEWEAARTKLLAALPRPEFFNAHTILDPGGNDPHAVHFAYWDFARAAYVVEDEILLRNGENTDELVETIQAKELALWGTKRWEGTLRGATEEPTQALKECLPDWMLGILERAAPKDKQPFARWMDTNLLLAKDLYELHGMAFIPTRKDNKELQVNNLRVAISAGQVYVHPRCVHTDRHWKGTTWKDHKRREFARKAGEHGDLVDTGCYGMRNLDKRNPEPPGWGVTPEMTMKGRAAAMQRKTRSEELSRSYLNATPLGRKLLKTR